jgi:lysophospholipase L1-like esterase
MGSHSGRGRPLKIGKAAVEAYGGWTWGAFMSIWKPGDNYGSKTKFMKMVNGQLEFAIQEYLDKYNGGKAPDIVILYLGCNDIATARMNDLERLTERSMSNRDRFLAALQKAMPNTLFGIALLAPANSRPEAFERNYKGMIPKQQYDYNQFSYIRRMQKDLQNSKNVSLIPFYVGVDDVEDYPQFNAVHPHAVGQKRLALMLEMWFKNVIQ